MSRTELPSRYVRTRWWVVMISRNALETSPQPSSALGQLGVVCRLEPWLGASAGSGSFTHLLVPDRRKLEQL